MNIPPCTSCKNFDRIESEVDLRFSNSICALHKSKKKDLRQNCVLKNDHKVTEISFQNMQQFKIKIKIKISRENSKTCLDCQEDAELMPYELQPCRQGQDAKDDKPPGRGNQELP